MWMAGGNASMLGNGNRTAFFHLRLIMELQFNRMSSLPRARNPEGVANARRDVSCHQELAMKVDFAAASGCTSRIFADLLHQACTHYCQEFANANGDSPRRRLACCLPVFTAFACAPAEHGAIIILRRLTFGLCDSGLSNHMASSIFTGRMRTQWVQNVKIISRTPTWLKPGL
ncbi:hypothetical protein M405DRAFT_885628 [Rhizopogon salebrosus TDB-379]|nr:hypothetical protein M405DRAFT_885628 [Rhizopogon salebrosus TDB-379]